MVLAKRYFCLSRRGEASVLFRAVPTIPTTNVRTYKKGLDSCTSSACCQQPPAFILELKSAALIGSVDPIHEVMATRADPAHIASLQCLQHNIRNFCILAHVDHGKTTLSDSLVSSNGIISAKLAGKLRYLDSTEEEQKRGITMHSSAISLLFRNEEKTAAADGAPVEEYLINLIDSPGHIDFSSDVSTATRLCDGALLVVDVLEGICTQTHAVVYKALKERMRPCLVLNKIDRLFIEMKLSTTEAFHHLKRVLEQVNALAYTLLKSELLRRNEALGIDASETEIEDDPLFEQWNFEPDKGNVIFCSALDCWGFGVPKFATLWAKRLEINRNVLRKYIFEDYGLNPTTKKIVKLDTSRGVGEGEMKPMFAAMVLDPLWQLYEAALVQQDATRTAELANKGFNVTLPPREVNPRDPRLTLQAALRRWLPLSDAVLRMIIRTVPDPVAAQQQRLFTLLPGVPEQVTASPAEQAGAAATPAAVSPSIDFAAAKLPIDIALSQRTEEVREMIEHSCAAVKESIAQCCNTADAPVVVFVSKMVPIRVADLSQRDVAVVNERMARVAAQSGAEEASPAPQLSPDGEVFLALGRVFSGTLKRDSQLYVLGSKYDPFIGERVAGDTSNSTEAGGGNGSGADAGTELVGLTPLPRDLAMGLYIMLGPSAVPVEQVPAGNIVGILGLSEFILKTATLSSAWAAHPMTSITFQSKPMLKVAVEPTSHQDLRRLESGLQQLHQFDPVVEVGVDRDTGQNTMTCLGELHLEQCVKALTERFAKCEVKVSEPLIAYRETVLSADAAAAEGANSGGGKLNTAPALPPPWCDIAGLSQARWGRYRVVFGTGNVALTVRCFPLHPSLVRVMEEHAGDLAGVDDSLSELHRKIQSAQDEARLNELLAHSAGGEAAARYSKFWTELHSAIVEPKNDTETEVVDGALASAAAHGSERQRFLSFGSQQHCTNALIFGDEVKASVWRGALSASSGMNYGTVSRATDGDVGSPSGSGVLLGTVAAKEQSAIFYKLWARLHSACTAAFRMAVEAGPLMREPMHAVGYVIEEIEFSSAVVTAALTPEECELVWRGTSGGGDDNSPTTGNSSVILTGQLISEMREALHVAALSLPVRIVEPVYKCDLQCDQSQLGNLYAVLAQRRGEVTSEDIIEGTALFLLSAHLPVQSSFGFAQQLLKKTSGLGTAPQLSFSHWSRIDTDPFWRPTTEDELEEFGELATGAGPERNLPRGIIDAVRKRKGLPIEEKVVAAAEKQRTISRKK